ncbi:FAD/NAD(P)-binding domain-containing protein [Sphaerulina musiva SO2202]|uniref:FAD/NAD(P)-binding domain-containing protein n=1 Tax=Sphaerulina musiva (strain SO2202) TaxID=692275 RepID=N1QNE3_SPHMS|nr:FAD/NAD(P)-binding domain-containing protein [Sphaerulina musiva SO2202]EMF17683.1 FAD/NAD(P)-binding domain-containing protein [Sphaerulina musiva SO2202]
MATNPSSSGLDVLILGGGIAGLTTALALTKYAPKDQVPRIRIFEIRPEPATIGGAVNLTPNALRMLDHLGALPIIRERNYGRDIDVLEIFDVYSGKIAESSFRGPDGKGVGNPPYKALRITRGDALKGVLAAIEQQKNITITCGKRTVKIDETEEKVTLHFEDGESVSGDLLMGCDGIHSVTRLKHVEPERKATYSGVSNAFGFAKVDPDFKVHFSCTAINFARRGMLLTSFHSPATDSIYVGGLMQVEDIGSRDGWKSVGADAERTRAQLLERFADAQIPSIKPLIEQAKDFYLWPVFTLSKQGKWSTNRVMLLGDAAHAMPPQGESTGIVFEDTVLFSRCLTRWIEKGKPNTMKEPFEAYEKLRRPRIDVAFEESKTVVKTVSDAGWLGHKIKTFIVPWYLWFTKNYREAHFIEDVTRADLGYD